MKKNLFGNAYLNMLWHCPADPRFHYWVHLPDCYYDEKNPSYQLMVIIHGTGCAVEAYMQAAKAWADEHHVALLAPMFPGGLLEHEDFNSYKMLSCGGQFTNRFLFAHPERMKAVSIGAPGRPTFLNLEEDYFWGVRDFKDYFDKELDLEAVAEVPVQLTVGEMDTKFIGDSPHGTNRVDRMKSLKRNLESHGVQVELQIIPGFAHEGGEKERVQEAQGFFEKFL